MSKSINDTVVVRPVCFLMQMNKERNICLNIESVDELIYLSKTWKVLEI